MAIKKITETYMFKNVLTERSVNTLKKYILLTDF